jgi:hypothetical protein
MKKILISVALALVLIIGMVVPVSADAATIVVNTVVNPTTFLATCTATVQNPNGYSIYIDNVTDMVFTPGYGTMVFMNVYDLPGYQTIPANSSLSWVFTYTVPAQYRGGSLVDVVLVLGKQNIAYGYYDIVLQYPYDYSIPLPELASGALLGVGLIGVGGFVYLRRKNSSAKI